MTNHRLSPHQNGNKKFHSTETLNLFTCITDTILEAIVKKNVTTLTLNGLRATTLTLNGLRATC